MCGGGAVSELIKANNQGILFYFCFFHNNSCNGGGHDLVLQNSSENNIDPSCYSTRNTSSRVSSNFNSIIDRSDWLRNDFGTVRFVSSIETQPNAIDTYACGIDKGHPCSTISHCLTQLIPSFVKDIEILAGTVTETKSTDCSDNTYTIYGQSDLAAIVQTESEKSGLSLFSVSTGTLTARDFVLVHDSFHPNNRGSSCLRLLERERCILVD
ncbi:uncharacterized protein MONOS_9277 [Monocercomonoides exilis]|uniref:uncharacterized protein n=1 Tax=Monocercomonoides exilis TaxID=2049356 RepID=UPI003559CAFC|nr:hypothetical protein MONOS_9277 [Monocercomonoides exilis]|eukprot:MONOS_9277.1-p1 / transcript=MONOS_9277.1 / gene=MONOS_9277 / organism=Monocercomonoides_exilis_PA203 / gene_product=unspecified product / transcript_product=unspecified product / location=Mono_scaffold00376:45125-45760(-) / protein_length=212 / sequence_SO=supercontig / SO=protein_coding / is_pseudo=false